MIFWLSDKEKNLLSGNNLNFDTIDPDTNVNFSASQNLLQTEIKISKNPMKLSLGNPEEYKKPKSSVSSSLS